jgi:hypothetical protein
MGRVDRWQLQADGNDARQAAHEPTDGLSGGMD